MSLHNWCSQNKYLIFFAFGLFLVGCSSSVRYSKDNQNPSKTVYFEPAEYVNAVVLESVTGTASYYSDKFHGKLTANGEVFDMFKVSAAHPRYPLETIIKVTNLKNNKYLIIRVNDRMPDFKGREIDLSYQAAVELDMVKDGIAEVQIDVLEWGRGKKVK